MMFEDIITSSKYVVDNAKHLKINYDVLDRFILNNKDIKTIHWLISINPYNFMNMPIEVIVNFLLIFESIDFSFWGDPKWTVKTNSTQEDGSIALFYSLLNYVKESNNTDSSNISKEEFTKILKGNIEIPLLEERYRIVHNISKTVNEKMDGNFYNFVKDINIDVDLFNIILKYFTDFKDESIYKGEKIYLYKLAQILVSDILHVREKKENIIVDYSHLVGCPDYKIPQTMRAMGILEYDDELASLVDNKNEIDKDSEYENEIRSSILVVIEYIRSKSDNKINAIDINDYIWLQSRNKSLNFKPYHLTRTTKY